MTDNIEAALGRGKRGKGFKEVKDKVVNYVKKNKGKLLKAVLIGAPIGAVVGATVGHLLTQGRRREPEPERRRESEPERRRDPEPERRRDPEPERRREP